MPAGEPLAIYVNEVRQVPPLTREAELACLERARGEGPAAETARKDLAEANLLLVVSIAERYPAGRLHILDLIIKGNEGLMRAVSELGGGCPDGFSAHAAGYIERAIEEALAAGG